MKKILIILFPILLFAYSCSKNQSYVRNLDGTWKVESVTYTGSKPGSIFVKLDTARYGCEDRHYEDIVKIWFYKCRLKGSGDCGTGGGGIPTNCEEGEDNWCVSNIIYPHDDNACSNGKITENEDFLRFDYRIEEKGKNFLVRDTDRNILIYHIVSLEKDKAVFEYNNNGNIHTVTLVSIEDDKI